MATTTELFQLDQTTFAGEYVSALFKDLKKFLLSKSSGHCQRLDFLPKSIMEKLGQRLATDGDLALNSIVCRVLSEKTDPKSLQSWEVSGSGAVTLREQTTQGTVKVFCALFPAGIQLSEEDSLNVSTFKTDDVETFNINKCLRSHWTLKVNQLPHEEADILHAILGAESVRRGPELQKLRYILSVLGERTHSGRKIDWEIAGAYLYELQLVPDLDLKKENYNTQLARNRNCTDVLLEGDRDVPHSLERLVEEQRLEEDIRRKLAVYLADKDLLDGESWLKPICHDEPLRSKLSFDNWKFAIPTTGIHVELNPLQDPAKPTKVAKGLELKGGELVNDGQKSIQIRWKVTPADSPHLGGFRICVLRKNEDGVDVDVIPPQSVKPGRKSFMVPMADNTLAEDEKCLARITIQALDKSGTPITDGDDQSEEFWIQMGEEITEPSHDRGFKVRHLDDLFFRVTYKTGKEYQVKAEGWDQKNENLFSRRLTNNERGDLVLTPLLLELERKLLAEPNTLGMMTAQLGGKIRAEIADFKPESLPHSINELANLFYRTREVLFQRIADQFDGTGVVEVTNLLTFEAEVVDYVRSYLDLQEKLKKQIVESAGPGGINNVLQDYALLQRIDTISISTEVAGEIVEVLLLSPTHPLRIAWLFQYQNYVCSWVRDMIGKKPEEIEALISPQSLEKIVPLNIPSAISFQQGQAFINTDTIDFFWTVYPSANSSDLRSAVTATLQALGIRRRETLISTVTPIQIADKIERYLSHHPYVTTLKVNVINPGDGSLLLEAMKIVLEREPFQNLNFDLKFFAPPGTRHHLIASAFDELMDQRDNRESGGGSLSETEERLLEPNENPLFPKLIYAKHNVQELLTDADGTFEAHLAFIIDYFSTSVATRKYEGIVGSSTLHNLLAEYLTDYTPGATTATWSRMIAPNRCPDFKSDGVTGWLFEMQDHSAHLSACFHDWNRSIDNYVTVQLQLTDAGGKNHLNMLRRVHLLSDWVFTIDRNFGIEYYDDPIKGPSSETGGYLIDYTPEFLDAVSHRLIISTYFQHEIESILRSGFARVLAPDGGEEAVTIEPYVIVNLLRVLKSVSGKLALKLINNPTQASEVIGLAVAFLLLKKEGRLTGSVVIPVDSHIGLFHQTRKELEHSEVMLKRTDLILAHFSGRRLKLNLIEVKNRRYSGPQTQLELESAIIEKNKSTEFHFRTNFLTSAQNRRFDADIKNKELANILSFYWDRAKRYGNFQAQSEHASSIDKQFRESLIALEAGACDVEFQHEGVIINGSSLADVESHEVQHNSIHVVGRAGVSRLMDLVVDEEMGGPPETPAESGARQIEAVATPLVPLTPVGVTSEPCTLPDGENTDATPAPIPSPEEAQVKTGPEPAEDGPSRQVKSFTADPTNTQQIDVYLGKNVHTSQSVHWNPYTTTPRKLSNQHILIVGKSGSGKSETTKSVIWELDRIGVPSIIFDYQGEYATGDFFKTVNPQVIDVMKGLPINPFELPYDPLAKKRRSYIEMVFRLSDTLNTVFSGSGEIQLGVLREAIDQCYQMKGFRLDDPQADSKELPTLELLEVVLEQWAKDRGSQVRNLLVRFQPLFKSGIFRKEKATFKFDALFQKTTVVLLTSGIKDLMLAAGRFILEKVYSEMLMAGVSKSTRVMVVVDEAHKLCGDETIRSLIKEARKYGLGLILSSQEARDFHPSLFANTGTLIGLALEDEDAGVMAKHLGVTDPKAQKIAKDLLLSQANGQALIRSQHFQPYIQAQLLSFEDRIQR